MRTTILITLVTLFILIMGNGFAEDAVVGQPASSSRFSIHDLNHDGVLDRYEYEEFSARRGRHKRFADSPQRYGRGRHGFAEIDQNADGYITEDELIIILNKGLRKQRRIRAREGQW